MLGIWQKGRIFAALIHYYNYEFGTDSTQMNVFEAMFGNKMFKGLSHEESATRFMTVMLNSLSDLDSEERISFAERILAVAKGLKLQGSISEDTLDVLVSVYDAKREGEDCEVNWSYLPS
jgi:hypothetical protein